MKPSRLPAIADGIRMAVRHPDQATSILANAFARLFHNAPWVTPEMKIRFCITLLDNYLESSIEERIGLRLIKKLRDKPINFGIRMLKRNPVQGVDVLVGLVLYELRLVQFFDDGEQREFIARVLEQLFPEFKSDTTA